MRWIVYLFLSLVVAGLGIGAGILIGSLYVDWYHVSSFEGGSGFLVLGLGLLGGLLGGILGFITGAVRGATTAPAHLKSFGVAAGIVTGLTLVILGLCRVFADIPPELDGRPLSLEVDIRLPVTVTQSPAQTNAESRLTLSSLQNRVVRRQEVGMLRPQDARQENGRWIVPGAVEVFTTRGVRSLDIVLNGAEVQGFIVPLPGRPGRDHLEWSDWLPHPPASEPSWPDTKPSYRFRVQKIPEPPLPPTQAEVDSARAAEETAAFEAIAADAPLSHWFPYARYGANEERRAMAIARMTAKPTFLAEMQQLMVHEDPRMAEEALRLVEHLPTVPPELVDSVTAAGRDIIERIRKVNVTTPDQDPGYEAAADVSIRFSAWMVAVRSLREKAGGDFIPELKTILEMSRVRPDSIVMRGTVCRVASYYLKEWAGVEPLPGDPPPR
jgi:hypothetical protein